ncbi:MAG: hypothetical protein V1824_03505, partial [archaeon]
MNLAYQKLNSDPKALIVEYEKSQDTFCKNYELSETVCKYLPEFIQKYNSNEISSAPAKVDTKKASKKISKVVAEENSTVPKGNIPVVPYTLKIVNNAQPLVMPVVQPQTPVLVLEYIIPGEVYLQWNTSASNLGQNQGQELQDNYNKETLNFDIDSTSKITAFASFAAASGNGDNSGQVQDPKSYKIYKDGQLVSTTINNYYIDNSINDNLTHNYTVKEIIGNLESENSNTISVKEEFPTISNLNTISQNASVKLNWILTQGLQANELSSIEQQTFYFSDNKQDTFYFEEAQNYINKPQLKAFNIYRNNNLLSFVDSSLYSYLDTTAINGTIYTYKIIPVYRKSGNETYEYLAGAIQKSGSAIVYETPIITSGSVIINQITINFSTGSNNQGENIYLQNVKACIGTNLNNLNCNLLPANSTTYTFSNLNPNTTYYVNIVNVYSNGTTKTSENLTLLTTNYQSPTNLISEISYYVGNYNSQVNLSWTAPAGNPISYDVYRKEDNGNFNLIVSGITTTQYIDIDTPINRLYNTKKYTYKIKANYGSVNYSDYSFPSIENQILLPPKEFAIVDTQVKKINFYIKFLANTGATPVFYKLFYIDSTNTEYLIDTINYDSINYSSNPNYSTTHYKSGEALKYKIIAVYNEGFESSAKIATASAITSQMISDFTSQLSTCPISVCGGNNLPDDFKLTWTSNAPQGLDYEIRMINDIDNISRLSFISNFDPLIYSGTKYVSDKLLDYENNYSFKIVVYDPILNYAREFTTNPINYNPANPLKDFTIIEPVGMCNDYQEGLLVSWNRQNYNDWYTIWLSDLNANLGMYVYSAIASPTNSVCLHPTGVLQLQQGHTYSVTLKYGNYFDTLIVSNYSPSEDQITLAYSNAITDFNGTTNSCGTNNLGAKLKWNENVVPDYYKLYKFIPAGSTWQLVSYYIAGNSYNETCAEYADGSTFKLEAKYSSSYGNKFNNKCIVFEQGASGTILETPCEEIIGVPQNIVDIGISNLVIAPSEDCHDGSLKLTWQENYDQAPSAYKITKVVPEGTLGAGILYANHNNQNEYTGLTKDCNSTGQCNLSFCYQTDKLCNNTLKVEASYWELFNTFDFTSGSINVHDYLLEGNGISTQDICDPNNQRLINPTYNFDSNNNCNGELEIKWDELVTPDYYKLYVDEPDYSWPCSWEWGNGQGLENRAALFKSEYGASMNYICPEDYYSEDITNREIQVVAEYVEGYTSRKPLVVHLGNEWKCNDYNPAWDGPLAQFYSSLPQGCDNYSHCVNGVMDCDENSINCGGALCQPC